MQYTLVSNGDESNITVYAPGEPLPLVAHSTHPNFNRIVSGALSGDDDVVSLFDIAATAAKNFNRLSERVTAANGRIYLDGDEINNALTTQILRFLDADISDWQPLVSFFDNVQANPEPHSREQLYEWLNRRDFTITPDGLIVGYKGCRRGSDGILRSLHSGPAIVDGKEFDGYVPNEIGSIIEIPRSKVHHDPSVGCSVGLHVGTYDYARGYASGGALLEVHVNPRDVVSVPTDSGHAKVRVCRYTVVAELTESYSGPLVGWAPPPVETLMRHQFEVGEQAVNSYDGDVVTITSDRDDDGDYRIRYSDGEIDYSNEDNLEAL